MDKVGPDLKECGGDTLGKEVRTKGKENGGFYLLISEDRKEKENDDL